METKERVEVLEKKIVRVEPIVRPRSFFRKGHDGEFMYTGCRRVYGLPYDSKKRSFFNPFLKEGEQQEFERLLNQKEGSLNLYDVNSKFWGTFTVSIMKDGLDLNLENASDALFYRIFLVDPKFAKDETSKDVPECEFVLVDKKHEERIMTQKGEIKDRAMDHMYKLKKSKEKMYNVLRLLGKKPAKDATSEWLKTELYKVIDENRNMSGVPNIDDFNRVMEDPDSEIKIFVLNAIDAEEIIHNNEGYRLSTDKTYLGRDIQSVYDYFKSNTPEVQEKKLVIEQRLKN